MTRYFEPKSPIPYLGPDSREPLAFRHYQADQMILGKSMREQLHFAACYWHNFCWSGDDTFGSGTFERSWNRAEDPLQRARNKADAAFEFFKTLTVPYYCFHDIDVAPEGESLRSYVSNLDAMTDYLGEKQQQTGLKLLWGTANCFSHPRYAAGAASNPDPQIFSYAASQVCCAMQSTLRLGGENYVLWGGAKVMKPCSIRISSASVNSLAGLCRWWSSTSISLGLAAIC
ncbi:apurinic/apyrimidinic endonuclease family protein [Dongshaea marina]|uniref:hypothetical protein n=1 Tax=Dongshaea marina TaxID=2047966 RepID=UPI0038990CB4